MIEPVYEINDWISADSKWINLVGSDNVFYPAQEDPKSGFPHVQYNSRIQVWPDDYWMYLVQVSYAMYFDSVKDSADAMNIILQKIKTGDTSAQRLNKWIEQRAATNADYDPVYEFHSFDSIYGGTVDPNQERGGAMARTLSFTVICSALSGVGIDI